MRISVVIPYGTYQKEFNNSTNYICELPQIGPLLLSVSSNANFNQVMVRSTMGWLIYTFDNDIIRSNCATLPILLSIYRYFMDVVEGWNISFVYKKSTYFDFFRLFGLGTSYPLKTNVELKQEETNLFDWLKTKALCNVDKLLLPKIISRFAKINYFDVEEIERFVFSESVSIKMNKNQFKDLFLGIKIDETVTYKFDRLSVNEIEVPENEIESLIFKDRSTIISVQTAIKEFLITQADYYLALEELYYSDIIGLKESSEVPEVVFNECFKEIIKVYKAEKAFIEDLFGQINLVKDGEIKFKQNLYTSKAFNLFNLLRDGESPEYSDSKLIKLFLKIFLKHSEEWKGFITFYLSYDLILVKVKEYSLNYNSIRFLNISDGFSHVLQRLTRYPLILKNIIEACGAKDKRYNNLKKLYLQLRTFIQHVEKLKEEEDNLRTLYKLNSTFKIDIDTGNQRFIDQLDCMDSNRQEYTIFILSSQIILAKREGEPRSFLFSMAKYTKIGIYENINVDFKKRGTLGFYLTSSFPLPDSKFSETHKDCSLNVRYFISLNESIRNRALNNFNRTKSYFERNNLHFSECFGEFQALVGNEKHSTNDGSIIINEISDNYTCITPEIEHLDTLEHVYKHKYKKLIYFKANDVYIRIGNLVVYVKGVLRKLDTFNKLFDVLYSINNSYLEIENKVLIANHLNSNHHKPFSSNDGCEPYDPSPLLGTIKENNNLLNVQMFITEGQDKFSVSKLSQIVEPQQFLKSKFVMQEIIELYSESKLEEFYEQNLYSNILNYIPKQVEDLIQKIVDGESYSGLFKSIFKSEEDVHEVVLDFITTNLYCYFLHEDITIIIYSLKRGEEITDVRLLSNKSFFRLLISYLKNLYKQNRSMTVYNFIKKLLINANFSHDELKKVVHSFSH